MVLVAHGIHIFYGSEAHRIDTHPGGQSQMKGWVGWGFSTRNVIILVVTGILGGGGVDPNSELPGAQVDFLEGQSPPQKPRLFPSKTRVI